MNSNYRPNSNPSIRRSVDGFVSTPSKNPYPRSNYQQNPRQATSSPSLNPQQTQFPPNNYSQRAYNQPNQTQFQRSPERQASNIYSSNQYNSNQFPPQNIYQSHIPTAHPEPKVVIQDTSTTLNSSIFPQNAQYYTKDYQVQDSQVLPQQAPQQPTQSYHNHNPVHQSVTPPQAAQSVIGSGSSISGTILSSSSPITQQQTQQNSPGDQEPVNYAESYNNISSSFQEINQQQGAERNSKFFPTTGTKMKIRPIPNTVKYNSWFSLEWIIETLKSFFGNSYRD